jgi:predicted ATPase
MKFSRLFLQSWRNFKSVDIELPYRVFIVGPNASGKSNLLDAFRFLRDIAETRGGFQQAIERRGGVSKIRSLHARQHSNVVLEFSLEMEDSVWRYRLGFNQDNNRRPVVREEKVWRGEDLILERPDELDEEDPGRLTQTHLEQVNSNKEFRQIASFFADVRYLHIVPQLIREPDRSVGKERDPFGGDFLEQLARLQKERKATFDSRLQKINTALKVAVPQLKELKLEKDEAGRPHLRGLYEHWRPDAGWQGEDQFSDGTLRLFGLFWALLDGSGPLLLEEPELSLHQAIIRLVPGLMWRVVVAKKPRRQIIVSTHSDHLLSDEGIAPEEVLLLEPTSEGTTVRIAAKDPNFSEMVASGSTVGEAALPRVAPADPEQLLLNFQR